MTGTFEALPPAQALALAEFARTCRAAGRAVSLYPATHPAIDQSLARVGSAAARLTGGHAVTLTILPDRIAIGGAAPPRTDVAIGELAAWLHERAIGSLGIDPAASAGDWLALLQLLARSPDDLRRDGGIGRALAATGHARFAIHEIDYAEVLRERAGGGDAEWQRIIAYCLQDDVAALDERAVAALIATFAEAPRLLAFLDALETAGAAQGLSAGARAAAVLQLLRRALDAIGAGMAGLDPADGERILQSMADVAPRLSPDMLLALLDEARAAGGEPAAAIDDIVDRMGADGAAAFVAHAVTASRGASERLAQAFQALVPDPEQRDSVLMLAEAHAREGALAGDGDFDNVWQSAASLLRSYSDRPYVSSEYGRELSAARTAAIDVERVADDPPDRVQAWMATVSEAAIRQLDVALLRDLLEIEADPDQWRTLAVLTSEEIERRAMVGEMAEAHQLAAALAGEPAAGRRPHAALAELVLEGLAAGPLVRHIVGYLRRADERDPGPLNALALAIGPRLAEPLAEALSAEDHRGAVRRLRELLLAFGAAGRQSVERLKLSSNPAVRRMAVDLLRLFGGHEALPELASMLNDADPQVQRESIRAIVQIGSHDSYAVLERVLTPGSRTRDTVVHELIAFRDDKAVPLLCLLLDRSPAAGGSEQAAIIDALGALGPHPDSLRALRAALHRGAWWAPYRTAATRAAAAAALRRLGSAEALACLEEAAASGARGVRAAARAQLGTAGATEDARR